MGRHENVINAKGIKGIFKDKDIKLIIEEHANNCMLYVDGKKIDNIITICINIKVGEPTVMTIKKKIVNNPKGA